MSTQTSARQAPGQARTTRINGHEIVLDYGDAPAELRAVQFGVGLMDRSAWGRLQAIGRDRLDFLQRMSTNDFAHLEPGQGRPTVFPDARGRMIDRVIVHGWEEEALMVGSLGAGEALARWLRQYIFFRDQVAIADLTTATGMLTLYGPHARRLVEMVLGVTPGEYEFIPVDGAEALVAGTDPLAGGGVNIIAERDQLPALWQQLTEAGAAPMGYSVYERLRIEAGQPAYGHEIADAYNPLEAGLLGSVSFTKGCYIGQEVVARLDTYQKLKQHLMGLRFKQLVQAATGAAIQQGERTVGTLTSIANTSGGAVGLGYVRASCAVAGATVTVVSGDECVTGELVELPGRWKRPFGMEIGD